MSLVKFLIISLLSSLVFIVIITNAQVQQNKTEQTLNEKVQDLLDMNLKKSVLNFDSHQFREHVMQSSRNYSFIVMFTAMDPAIGCEGCRRAHDEYTIAADSYRNSPIYSNKLFFAMIDFEQGSDIFNMFGINTAPVFVHFPPHELPNRGDILDNVQVGFSAEAILKFVHQRTAIQISISHPINYSRLAAVITLVALLAGFVYWIRNNLQFLYNKHLWGFLIILFCFAMISGQMWNHIRGPPLVGRRSSGAVMYVYGSSEGQLVIETYIVIFLNAMIVLGMILLIESGLQSRGWRKGMMTIIGLVSVVICFSMLVSVFRFKLEAYPYRLLFK